MSSVIEMVACPRSSWTYLGCFPARRRMVAQVWLRSWKRTSGSPARRRSGLKLRVMRSWRDRRAEEYVRYLQDDPDRPHPMPDADDFLHLARAGLDRVYRTGPARGQEGRGLA